jgi:hypothetical protein
MQFKKIAAAIAAASLAATPVMASASPAASLSVASQVRAGATSEDESQLFAGLIGTLLPSLVGLVATYFLADELFEEDAASA